MQAVSIALEKVDFVPPARVTDDTSILTLKNLVFEPLCRWDNGAAFPALFSRWEHSPDGRRWRFEIRPNAVFHDGKPCEATDILGFIDGLLNAVDMFGMKWSYARYFAETRFSALSATAIGVDNPQPIADILDIFSEFFICRVAGDGSAVLGTGPYRVVDFTPRIGATLERVRDGQGPQRLSVRAVPDADERYRALRDGFADVALNLERMRARIDHAPQFRWHRELNTLSVIYYLNCAQGLFASPEARLAVNHAVDAKAIIDELFQGLGVPAATIVSPHHLGARSAALAPIAYAPDRAKALFEAAGASDEIVIRTPEYMPEKSVQISEIVRDSLARVGVRARLDVQQDRPEYAREIGRKAMGDMAIFDSSPHSTFRVLNDKISSATKAVWWQGHDDPALEELIVAANRAVTLPDRERAYGKCLARLHANPPWLYLFHPIEVCAARMNLEGFSLDHKGVLVVAQ
jgi:peptide/nickel transport system substrate-binding protein